MLALTETLGMSLPGNTTVPGADSHLLRMAFSAGEAVLDLLQAGIRISGVLTSGAVENALRVLRAIGGSTNAVLHLQAIAAEAGLTFNGHPLAMAAVIAAVEQYSKEDGAVFRCIEELGDRLRKGLEEIAREHGLNLLLQGYPGALYIIFTDRDKIRNHTEGCEAADIEKAARFEELLKERGVITARRFLLSAAHNEEDIEETLDRADESIRRLKEEWGGQ